MKLTLTLPDDIYRALLALAERERRTLADMGRRALLAYVSRRKLTRAYVSLHRQRKLTREKTRVNTGDSAQTTAVEGSSSTKAVIFTPESFVISSKLLSTWIKAYPAVQVEAEIRQAHAWILANPANTKSNWQRYLVNWLKRAQDRAPRVTTNVESMKIRPAILNESRGVTPMPAEIREQMRKIVEGVKMP